MNYFPSFAFAIRTLLSSLIAANFVALSCLVTSPIPVFAATTGLLALGISSSNPPHPSSSRGEITAGGGEGGETGEILTGGRAVIAGLTTTALGETGETLTGGRGTAATTGAMTTEGGGGRGIGIGTGASIGGETITGAALTTGATTGRTTIGATVLARTGFGIGFGAIGVRLMTGFGFAAICSSISQLSTASRSVRTRRESEQKQERGEQIEKQSEPIGIRRAELFVANFIALAFLTGFAALLEDKRDASGSTRSATG